MGAVVFPCVMTRRTPYPSDLTDAWWELVAPFIPPAKHGGRPRATDMLEDAFDINPFIPTGLNSKAQG